MCNETHPLCFYHSTATTKTDLFSACSKKFGMRAQTNQADDVHVNPNQEKIAADMTFHASLVLAGQQMRPAVFRKRLLVRQATEYFKQGFHLFPLVGISLEVLLVLGSRNELLHIPIDLSMLSTLERSMGFMSSVPSL